jgi:hypothetical protein
MSRVLVKSETIKKTKNKDGDLQLKKINDADGDTGDPAAQSDEHELNYSVSSESDDNDENSNI